MLIEITEDKFGNLMKDVACIEDKLNAIREVFEHEAVGHRKNRRSHYDDDDMDYRDYDRRGSHNRYM